MGCRRRWAAIAWNIVFSAINLWQIQLLLHDRRPVSLGPDELRLYQIAFRRLTEREFAQLLAIGQWKEMGAGQRLVRRGEALDQLIVLASGGPRRSRWQDLGRAPRGLLVGEMSFVTGQAPNADVVAMEPTRTVSWQGEVLRKLLETNVELRAAVQQVIGEDLIAKLRPA